MDKCKDLVKRKIAINMKEYESGKYVSRAQAIAVSYAQIKKNHPECKEKLKYKFDASDIFEEHKVSHRHEDGILIIKFNLKNNGGLFNKLINRVKKLNKTVDMMELHEGNIGYILIHRI